MEPGSAKMDMVNMVDAHAKTPQKRKRFPDEASTEPWSVAKSDMTVTSDMGRWEKADLDDSQNDEELLTEELEDMLDKAYGRRPTPTPTPSPPSWVAPLQEDQDSQVLADLPIPQKQFPSTAQKPQHPGMRCWSTWGRSWWQRSTA